MTAPPECVDAAVIGGGPAGAALAGLLGSGPTEQLVLERADGAWERRAGCAAATAWPAASTDTERLLDGFLTGCLLPEKGLFEASGGEQAKALVGGR